MELLVLVAVALVLPPWPRRIVATIAGLLFSVLTFDKILNMAMWQEVDRSFNPLNDWGNILPAVAVLLVLIYRPKGLFGMAEPDLLAWIGKSPGRQPTHTGLKRQTEV